MRNEAENNVARSVRRALAVALAIAVAPPMLESAGVGAVGADASAAERKSKPRRIPNIQEATFRRLSEAQELIDAEQYAEAIDMLEGLVVRERRFNGNERAQMHNMLAWAFYEIDDVDKTIYHYEQLLAQMPDINEGMEVLTLNQLSKLYFTQGSKYEDEAVAMGWYRKALQKIQEWLTKTESPGPDAHYYIAQIYYQMKNYPSAIEQLEMAVALSRERGTQVREPWWMMLQNLYFVEENWPKVVEILEILVKEFPKRSYWLNLAAVYGELNEMDKQLLTLEAAHVAGFLTQESDIITYSGLLAQAGVPNRATKHLRQAINDEVVPETVKSLRQLGQAYQLALDVDEAIPVMEKTAELSDDGIVYQDLAALYLDKDQSVKCETAAKKALDKGGLRNPLRARITLATCQANLAKLSAAKREFVQVRRDARRDRARNEERIASQWIKYIDSEIHRRDELARAGG